MKKVLLCLAMAAMSVSAMAQREMGEWSFIPRIGVNFANISGDNLLPSTATEGGTIDNKMRPGLFAGADVEYQELDFLSTTVGVYYSMVGCKYSRKGTKSVDVNADLQYLSMPIMENFYIIKGLAVKAGVQLNYLFKARYDGGMAVEDANKTGTYTNTPLESTFTDNCNRFEVSIPFGVSYEYSNMILDLRYNLGLTKIEKSKYNIDSKNNMLMLTFGYRIEL